MPRKSPKQPLKQALPNTVLPQDQPQEASDDAVISHPPHEPTPAVPEVIPESIEGFPGMRVIRS